MPLNNDEVKKIAHLARLNLSQQDVETFTSQLSNILQLIAEMSQQDTTNIEPMAHPLELGQRLREDKVTEVDEHKKFQKIAPQVDAGLYLVPKVIDEA
jgi:aspartyl-tRNA(Asn)/glutamyl-tRNA(Gln) amidotransferase subunit C